MSNARPELELARSNSARRRTVLSAALVVALMTGVAVAADTRPGRSSNENVPEELQVLRGAERGAPVTPSVFEGDLRDLPALLKWSPGDPVKEIPRRHYSAPGDQTDVTPPTEFGVDPLLAQQSAAPLNTSRAFTTPSRNFAGLGFSGVNPPDTVGDVGPDHYIQSINSGGGSSVRVWDKASPTPNVLATFAMDSLGSGNCASGYGDPVVLYDRLADRWMLSEFSSSGNRLCVYISRTPDPITGGWYNYDFQAPTFPDYPKYGIWPTDANNGDGSYMVTANDGGPGVYALDRGKMIAGIASSYQRFAVSNLPGFSFEAPTPADLDGQNPPPDGAGAIIMRHRDTESHSGPAAPGDLLEMWLFHVDWLNASNSSLVQQASIDVSEFDSNLCGLTSFSCFDQPSGPSLDPLREVIMFRLQYRNSSEFGEVLSGNLVTDVDGTDHGGLRWFELRGGNGNWQLFQEGTFAPDSDSRWMAASATDQSGNFAIAYNVASSGTYPSLRYSGRLMDDPPGTLTQGDNTIHEGTASNSSNRYGDYAAMGVDPADDCTFWFTGMNNTSSNWRTQVASFAFDACGCDLAPSTLTVNAEAVADNEIEVSWNDADLETVIEYSVLRSRTAGGPYDLIATVADTSPGVGNGADTFFTDTDASGGTTYYYIVRASDGESCRSEDSTEVSATGTGSCTLLPLFGGIQSVLAPALNNCTLNLSWAPATDQCGGPVSYNVYRSNDPGFLPGAGNLVAAGVGTTAFSDFDQLVDGTTYNYIVRAVDEANDKEDENLVRLWAQPRNAGSLCTTVSACAENPFVDVLPNGPLTICEISGFALTASTDDGAGPFTFQWTQDGVDIPGANSASFVPTALGTHSYNVKVQAAYCTGFVFDGLDSEVTLVNAPFFDGVTQVVNPQTDECSLDVLWGAGATVCDGPVRYFVFRDTVSPVTPTAENLLAAGVQGTAFTDSAGLVNGASYHYLVRAQDGTTGQLEQNTVEATAFPDGPGGGPQHILDEDFESANALDGWTVTTGPGVHTCGEWERSDVASARPSGGSGGYALANNDCHPILGRTSATLTSPSVSGVLGSLVGVSLEYDLFYNHDGNESGSVEVYDGSSWVTVWQSAGADVNAHHSIDVTAWAAGNSEFRVRFDYQDAIQDKWMSVDNVQVIAMIDVQCSTGTYGPAEVPDGSAGTSPLRGALVVPNGDTIDVSWDASSCTATEYNLLYGNLADVAALAFAGSECDLGATGSFTWSAVPSGDLFFLVVGTDGAGTESGWGRDANGGEREGLFTSGQCGVTVKDVSTTCP